MPAIAIVGSVDSGHGGFCSGVVSSGNGLMTVNGIPVAETGSVSVIHVKPNTPPHVGIVMGGSKMTINGVVTAMVGNPTACGAIVASGQELMQIS